MSASLSMDDARRIGGEMRKRLPDEVMRPTLGYANTRIGAAARSRYMRDAPGEAGTPNTSSTLRIIKGRLVRSITAARGTTKTDMRGEGFVEMVVTKAIARLRKSSLVPYFATHEKGFSGTVEVPSHTRQITKPASRSVTVKAHTRQMETPKRPTLGPAMLDEATRIATYARKRLSKLLASITESLAD